MPKYVFEVYRRSIVCETYFIEADSEEEALEMANYGDTPDPQIDFIDWYDDTYTVEGKECIDPLYKMVKDYKSVDKLDV